MGFKGMYLYATRADHELVYRILDALCPLIYTRTGMLKDPPEAHSLNSLFALPEFGFVEHADTLGSKSYLIAPLGTTYGYEEITLTRGRDIGTVRYSTDERHTPDTIRLQPGGLFQEKWLIQGNVGTGTDNPKTLGLYNRMVRELKKRYVRVGGVWLGPDANRLFEAGFCLTDYAGRKEKPCLERTVGSHRADLP